MATRLRLDEARVDLDAVLAATCHGPVVLEDAGEARAVVLSPEDFEKYQAFVRQRLAAAVAAIREANKDADPEQVMREVTAVVEEVRGEMYDRIRRS
jgi:putative intracellular protease/amidase